MTEKIESIFAIMFVTSIFVPCAIIVILGEIGNKVMEKLKMA